MELFGKNIDDEVAIIAEIGVNHEGSLEMAKKLIELASNSGADAVKFQSYTPDKYISRDDIDRFNRVKKFYLSEEDHLQLINFSKTLGINFFSTPVTEDWLSFLDRNAPVIKIASGDITFEPVIRGAAELNKPVILSTGAANEEEINQAINWFKDQSKIKDIRDKLILLHCVSAYPTPMNEVNLLSIQYLREKTNLRVGYSNHAKGILAPLSAIALGANVIEVHFTDSRENKKFHDHQLSLNPEELKYLVDSATVIKSSLGFYGKKISVSEKNNISAIRKGIVAARKINRGSVLVKEDLMFARPASQINSKEYKKIIGKKCSKDYERGNQISFDSLLS